MIKIALIFNDMNITQSLSAPSSPCSSEYGNNETEVELSSSSSSSSSIKFTNHYSSNVVLSSTVRVRNKKLWSWGENSNNQFVIENECNNNLRARRAVALGVTSASQA